MATVLCLIFPGFEELEAVAPIDVLRRAGVTVTVASLGPDRTVTGRNGIVLTADTTFGEAFSHIFDLVLLPGGPGVRTLRADPRVPRLLRDQVDSGRPVAAICAAPTALADAGLLEGRRFTAHPSVDEALPGRIAGEEVVEDGPIITSQGAGTALAFGIALVARLVSPEVAADVRKSIAG